MNQYAEIEQLIFKTKNLIDDEFEILSKGTSPLNIALNIIDEKVSHFQKLSTIFKREHEPKYGTKIKQLLLLNLRNAEMAKSLLSKTDDMLVGLGYTGGEHTYSHYGIQKTSENSGIGINIS